VPLGRLGGPSDIAKMTLFLVSEDSVYITGETICVSGGRYMPASSQITAWSNLR
jgi:NAD(P)-dependent dehydrogenase (short-subunit alcohol dehydrogenase family)